MSMNRSAAALRQDDVALRKWHAEVAAAAVQFERRWTVASLCRVDATLAQRLREQRDLFDQAMLTGTARDIEEHGAAMCRGYRAACGALERSGLPDDAYQLGRDPATGLTVAIGLQKAAAARVAELYPGAVHMTADEVATILAGSADAARFAAAVKRLWPGAEMVEVVR